MDLVDYGFLWVDEGSLISPELRTRTVTLIDSIIEETPQTPERPSFQTGIDLFNREGFSPYKDTFLESCLALMPRNAKNFIASTRCSAYMDYWDNYKSKDRDAQWHFHEKAYFSGIFYLHIPDSMDPKVCGTEFRDPDIYVPPRIGHWLIFPGHTLHRPGISNTNDKRYVLAADFMVQFIDNE